MNFYINKYIFLRSFFLGYAILYSVCAIAVTDKNINITATSADSTILLSELSVTAIKQGKNIQKQAISSTILGKQSVERLNITDAKSASSLSPNFFIPDYGSRVTSSIYVRGLGARIDQPVVGMNVDNVPIMSKDNYDFDMIDIERIEILRGPQSTLYGRNTMGGLINIYTLSPLSYQGLRILGSYSSGNSYKAGISYYSRINDKLGISIGGYNYSTDGFYKNLNNNKNCDWEHSFNGRFKLQWRPSSSISIDNSLSLSILRQGGYPYEYIETGVINYNDTCFYRRTSVIDGLSVRWNIGNINISSITSYQYSNDNMTLDQDFLPVSYFTLTQARREHSITQDFVIRSNENHAYRWLVGAFGFYRHYDMDAPVTFKDYGITKLIEEHRNQAEPLRPVTWDTREFVLGSNFKLANYGLALYHQSVYRLNRFTFTGGIRLDYEHSALDYVSNCNTGYTVINAEDGSICLHDNIIINDPGSLSQSFFEVLPKLSVVYDLDTKSPSNLFLSIAKGYKAGGYNTQMFSDVLQQRIMGYMGLAMNYDVNDIVSYKPEKSWTFELGTHFECFNRRIRTDISAFYIHCTDQQLTIFPDGNTTGRIMTNAGRTRSFGAEVAIKAIPIDALELDFSYGYTNARFIEFNNGKSDYSGKTVPYAPQNTIFAGANYTFGINSAWLNHIIVGANVRAVGDIYWNEANDVKQGLYSLLGASVRLEQRNCSLDLWTTNLTDTAFNTFYFVSIGNTFLQRGKPRQLGATFRINI